MLPDATAQGSHAGCSTWQNPTISPKAKANDVAPLLLQTALCKPKSESLPQALDLCKAIRDPAAIPFLSCAADIKQ